MARPAELSARPPPAAADWMWFLYVPLISYALFFALQFVEFVTEQARG